MNEISFTYVNDTVELYNKLKVIFNIIKLYEDRKKEPPKELTYKRGSLFVEFERRLEEIRKNDLLNDFLDYASR